VRLAIRILLDRTLFVAQPNSSDCQKENVMKRRITFALSTMALLFLGMGLPASNAVAQQKSIKEQIVGSWSLVSVVNIRPDGSRYDPTAGKAVGLMTYDGDSNFSSLNIRTDIPKLASNNRQKGTTDEYKAVAEGVLCYFGRYSTDEAGKFLIQHVVSSSFPNFNGTDRKWSITISGDELTLASQAAASGGGSNELKWKRAK
jgi:Lipocalin-like domain